ncbi:murein biosynthesis integral membrane protein MurJ [Desertibaculum subflavum]|uniref:murein biosynthesis integral membrane protein MurJ n=1 Tax=Desertibaculum subflavum TaxID=2268458 RepID=UPI000E66B1ED
MSLIRSVATVGGLTLASRILGFVRDLLTAATLGAGLAADAFFVALQLPNMFRRLFAEGAFNAAFVPIFAERLSQGGRPAAFSFAEAALSALLATLLVFTGLCEIFAPQLITVLAPGFIGDPERFALTTDLLRLTFPYLLFISLVSLLAGVLNAFDRFAAAAAAPIMFNLCLIVALLIAHGLAGDFAYALAWAVSIAGVLQFLWLAIACRRLGLPLRLPWPRLTPEVRLMLRRMLPAAIGAGAVQINLFVNLMLSSLLPAGAISFLFYANRLMELPLGIIGVALGTALLPLLSREIAAGRVAQGMAHQNRGIELGLLLTLPAAVAMVAIPEPIIRVLFERGAFGPAETAGTAQALMAYGMGVPAFILIRVLVPGFHARGDTVTPLRVALAAVAVNLALNLALIRPLGHVGLALATSTAAWAQALLFSYLLRRREHWRMDRRLKRVLPRQIAAAIGMGVLVALAAYWLDAWLHGPTVHRVAALVLIVGGGAVAYFALCHLLGAARAAEVWAQIRRRPTAQP